MNNFYSRLNAGNLIWIVGREKDPQISVILFATWFAILAKGGK